ncbi:MAG: undecaprenyl-diphosphate phosphatase [Rhodospirillales bacterium]|nr:undecaprenyl-diphosphate phosphatase [Rhodospirillales bacterium]
MELYSVYLIAVVLGLVEGVTEFLPVSSTGHLILVGDLLGFQGPQGEIFEVVIQLGAILAVVWLYRAKFLHVAITALSEPASRRFITIIVLGVLPALVIGAFLHDFIKSVLFSPWVVSVTLILGGFAILAIERWHLPPKAQSVEAITPMLALKIGFCQCVAMIPGVSRSGATIMGGLLLGVGRAAATEFSFFLAVPTMLAATTYDMYKGWSLLHAHDLTMIGVGFVVSFLSAMVVVRWLVGFVSKNGFAPFAYYRIVIGLVMLAILIYR